MIIIPVYIIHLIHITPVQESKEKNLTRKLGRVPKAPAIVRVLEIPDTEHLRKQMRIVVNG